MLRRFASVAALALVAGLALSGCQTTSSSVAVQIGDFTVTNERVDEIVDLMDEEVIALRQSQQASDPAAAGATATPAPVEGLPKGQWRATVVQLIVFDELARRMLADMKVPFLTPDYEAAAGQIGLKVSNPYVKLAVDSDAYRTLLFANLPAQNPSPADFKGAYDKVLASGAQVGSYEETLPQLQALTEFAQGLGVRPKMIEALDKYNVVVNPRYQPLELPLVAVGQGGQILLVSVPLRTSGSPAVRDLPPAAPDAA